jgi:hypothetical protein
VSVSAFNPELVRNTRIQLRRGRMLATATVCFAVSLSCAAFYLSSRTAGLPPIENARNLFQLILTFQIVALLIGGGIYCLQSVHREKDLNTFDYQRITRMTPFELAVGKLLGAPALPYFAVLCLMPIACWAAIRAQVPVSILLQIYVLVILGSITYHALALLISLLLERGTSAGGILFFLMFVGMSSIDFSQGESAFAAHELSPFFVFTILSPSTRGVTHGVSDVWGFPNQTDSFFGVQVSHFWVLIVLYATLTGWFLLASARNIKRDPSVYEVYSPVQGFALVLYLNLLLLGFFRWIIPHFEYSRTTGPSTSYQPLSPATAEGLFLSISLWSFVILGVALLRNRDRVRRRIREYGVRAAGSRAAVWPAPYLFAGAVVAGFGIVGMIRLKLLPQPEWNPGLGLLQASFFATWIVRDLLYLQWMNLRRARRPLVTGVLYLIVFYICASTLFVPLGWYGPMGAPYATIFVPFHAFQLNSETWISATGAWVGALILLLLETLLFAWLQWWELQKLLTITLNRNGKMMRAA